GGRVHEHRVRCEQRREHDDVAQEEDPEAEAGDDPLGSRAAFDEVLRTSVREGDLPGIDGNVHAAPPPGGARAKRTSSSDGISVSSFSRNAKKRVAANAPSRPKAAI